MTIRTIPSLLLLGLTGITACAGGAGTTRPVRERTIELPGGQLETSYRPDARGVRDRIEAPVDAVRAALVDAYEELGFGVDDVSETRVVTPFFRIRGQLYDGEPNSRYLSCGTEATGQRTADLVQDVRFRMLTVLTGTDGATDVETRIEGEARRPGRSEAPVACTGTGVLEHRVNVRVMAGLAVGAG
ncbi:MAG: hypothetical protein GWM90_12710 [Gemmatimonadetes bacterium]|nr:hypothetical protein [Gemmatimonadota bacterium]NIQ54918.1 hypothetical protein [Gemmatimonadota bacterium]NIU75119.1 hypothetical protein [Gammaproteobacteria bacterium]NIX44944.1 hypothetical protein [Gemmatimonadota bacterium]NIY09177.1 hypothetical protein [Gemmatimonadota bacterium]